MPICLMVMALPPSTGKSSLSATRGGEPSHKTRPGRGEDRPEDQDHPALGQTRNPASGTQGPVHQVSLHLQRHLPRTRHGRCPRPAQVRQPGHHAVAPGGNLIPGEPRRSRRRHPRSGRMARLQQAPDPGQHHASPPAAKGARTEPSGERLAVPARQLAVQHDLQILRSDRRTLLPSLEQAHRTAFDHNVHRNQRLGTWVLVNADWY